MSLELRPNSKSFYARIQINGERKLYTLKTQYKGTPPPGLSMKLKGDELFELSKEVARNEEQELKETLNNKDNPRLSRAKGEELTRKKRLKTRHPMKMNNRMKNKELLQTRAQTENRNRGNKVDRDLPPNQKAIRISQIPIPHKMNRRAVKEVKALKQERERVKISHPLR